MKIKSVLITSLFFTTACYEPPAPAEPEINMAWETPPYVKVIDNKTKEVELQYSPQELAWRKDVINENRSILDTLKRYGADVYYSKRGVVVNVYEVLFEFDSDILKREGQIIMRAVADVTIRTNRELSIEGHADEVGSVMYNYDLAQRRAKSVENALAHEYVDGAKMRVRSYGKGNPIDTNNTEKGRANNRRVEIVIENPTYNGVPVVDEKPVDGVYYEPTITRRVLYEQDATLEQQPRQVEMQERWQAQDQQQYQQLENQTQPRQAQGAIARPTSPMSPASAISGSPKSNMVDIWLPE